VVVALARLFDTPVGQTERTGLELSVALGATTMAVLFGVVAYILWRRKQLDQRLDAFIGAAAFRIVEDASALERVARRLDALYGAGAKILRAAVRTEGPFEMFLVSFRFPQYRAEPDGSWDESLQESVRRVALLVSGFGAPLPVFRLLPNNWAVRVLRGHSSNRFGDVEPFGAFNYVMAPKHSQVREVLGGELQRLLGRNKWLAIDGREDFLAFYGNGDAEQPTDLRGFLDQSLNVSRKVRERVGGPDSA
jgi:hypothetical protein